MNPSLTNFKYVRPLEGYSGAHIFLCSQDNRHWFVRKIAKDQASSPRLKLQIEKQTDYADLINHIFETPKILETGEIEGIFYADLEFINGADGAYYLRNAELEEVKHLSFKLQEYLEFLATRPTSTIVRAEKLIQKVQTLGSQFKLDLDLLLVSLDKLNDLQLLETSYHGDFTFENLIFHSSGKIYLLDLLDAPINHYWMDCSKLFQDLNGLWFIRNTKPLPKFITSYLGQSLYSKLISLDLRYAEFHNSLLITNFLRILPYVQNQQDHQLILQRIEFLLGKI